MRACQWIEKSQAFNRVTGRRATPVSNDYGIKGAFVRAETRESNRDHQVPLSQMPAAKESGRRVVEKARIVMTPGMKHKLPLVRPPPDPLRLPAHPPPCAQQTPMPVQTLTRDDRRPTTGAPAREPFGTAFEAIQELARDDRLAVDREINARLESEVALIGQLGAYIIGAGGKRLRPLIVLLAARACGYAGNDHRRLAAIVEFIHTATLLHDDVVDASTMRRGRSTANAVWGNEASVLVGDFLYSRAFEMMVEINSMRVMKILAHTTNAIAEGEVMQLLNCHDPDTSEQQYLSVIGAKTARLFEAAGELGAVIAGQNDAVCAGLAAYGLHVGTAFQLVDDILDYRADPKALGKNVGDDLAEGKPTLPVIHALRVADPQTRARLALAIQSGGTEHIEEVVAAIDALGSIAYTARLAEEQASRAALALDVLPASRYKDALLGIARFAVERDR